jgi:hypothetical protein
MISSSEVETRRGRLRDAPLYPVKALLNALLRGEDDDPMAIVASAAASYFAGVNSWFALRLPSG